MRRFKSGLVRLLLYTAIARLFTFTTSADGCFVFRWNKEIDINEPTQKAIIVYDNGREDLLLQVKYEGPLQEFGWLVPVPSEPKVERGSMDAFYELSQLTQVHFHDGTAGKGLATTSAGSAGPEPPVKVIETKTVGAYEVAILSARDSGSLQKWLQANGYSIPRGKSAIIDDYIQRGWYFIAAKIQLNRPDGFHLVTKSSSSSKSQAIQKDLAGGELHPLLISFGAARCVFPLKISAVGGKPSEVSVYVLSEQPLLNRFLFDETIRNIEREYAEWESSKESRAESIHKSTLNSQMMSLSIMLTVNPDGTGARRNPLPRDWTNEDLEAMAQETAPPKQPLSLHQRFYSHDSLLRCLHADSGQLKKSARSLPRLKNKSWSLTKFTHTFAPSEMRDLEFEPATPVLVEALSRPYGGVAAGVLALAGPAGVSTLLEACKSNDSNSRMHAAAGLQMVHDPRAIDVLAPLLEDQTPGVRFEAARAVERNPSQKLNAPMRALLRDPHPDIRSVAIDYLALHDRGQTAKYLKLLDDRDFNVRMSALGLLLRMDREAIPSETLLRMFRESDPQVQSSALHAIWQLKRPILSRAELLRILRSDRTVDIGIAIHLIEGVHPGPKTPEEQDELRKRALTSEEIVPLATHQLSHERLAAVRFLQRNADAKAVELILPMLHDKNSIIRSRAFAALKTITGQEISNNDPALWEKWWEANKNKPLPTKASP